MDDAEYEKALRAADEAYAYANLAEVASEYYDRGLLDTREHCMAAKLHLSRKRNQIMATLESALAKAELGFGDAGIAPVAPKLALRHEMEAQEQEYRHAVEWTIRAALDHIAEEEQ